MSVCKNDTIPPCAPSTTSAIRSSSALNMFRPAFRTAKPVRFLGKRRVASNARGTPLPTSTIITGLLGVGSAAYAYALGLGNGRATALVQNTSPSKPRYGGPEQVQQAVKELQAALPNQVRVDLPTVEAYGFSPHTYLPGSPHAVYVAVTSTEDVVKVVNISRKYKVPIIPFGVGNSLEGQFAGVSPFLLLDYKIWSEIQETASSRKYMRRFVRDG